MNRVFLSLLALLLLVARPAGAQDVRVQLVTVGPGETYFERFGHNAIVIQDAETGDSISYNYGMFDFEQENFFLNFVRGHMLYQMVGFDGAADIAHYIRQGRRVTVQELDLDPDQIADLVAYLEWNRQPHNADYRYDYFLANCSTKVRDALDRAVGGAVRQTFESQPSEYDFRYHVRRLARPLAWMYGSTLVALGQAVDRPLSVWEEFFLPMELERRLGEVVLDGGRPLVRSTTVLAEGRVSEPSAPPSWVPYFLGAGLILGLAVWRFSAIRQGWWLLSGAGGLVLAGLWWFTDHWAAAANENLLLLSPLGLFAVVAAWRKRPRGVRQLAAVCLGLAVVAIVGKLTPWFDQGNAEFLALFVPLHLAAWLAVRKPEQP